MGGVGDEGAIDGGLEFRDESAKTRGERLQCLGGVVTLHVGELFIVGLCGAFEKG